MHELHGAGLSSRQISHPQRRLEVMIKVWHGKYAYPRYFFNNESEDIRQLFRQACDLIGVEHRDNRRNSISVAKRESVARLDECVGPKR